MSRFLAAALLLAACGGGALELPSPQATTHHPSPTADLIDQMMGAPPDTTVFVASGHELLAVTLLNHFVRYRLPLGESAQVVVSRDAASLWVVDEAGADLRLRRFDAATGALADERTEPLDGHPLVATGGARGAVAEDGTRLLLLRKADAGLLVHAYRRQSLVPLGQPAKNDGCADRVLAAASEYALVCRASGVHVFWDGAGTQQGGIASVAAPIAGAAMAGDGMIATAGASGELRLIRPRETRAERLDPLGWVKTSVAPDGLAWADEFRLVIAESGRDVPRPRVTVVDRTTLSARALDLPNRVANGILASGQFAYWVADDASGVYHVDLESGLVERMFGPLQVNATLAGLAVH